MTCSCAATNTSIASPSFSARNCPRESVAPYAANFCGLRRTLLKIASAINVNGLHQRLAKKRLEATLLASPLHAKVELSRCAAVGGERWLHDGGLSSVWPGSCPHSRAPCPAYAY